MGKEGQNTVTFSGTNLIELREKHAQDRAKHPSLSFSKFISESALMELERRKLLKDALFISLVSVDDNVITLKDVRNTPKFIEVQVKDKKIKCLTDNEGGCIHVGFSLALPEVRKALVR